ncbi:MAG: aminotransferase class I/II-fold pyridoxal phosphate-dependent enzyme [Prevotellaceae bacterium]|jgi:threonine aldolase|nr:aminotransferase class I/II-fold pyridoxal phosphate-dependent enzyme [Prevotellaceae bacterium]
MRSFGSDNHSGVHPDIMRAIEEANADHAAAYGDDFWSKRFTDKIKEVFGATAEAVIVFNGTGANVVALQAATQSFHAVIAPQTGHIVVDECGSPGFMTGTTIKTVNATDGKLTPELLKPFLHDSGNEHHSQPKVAYISQSTELGTVYSTEEICALADFLHRHNMYLHLDGARIANAAVSLGKTLKEITVDCGIDILSFGGTKNGLMMGESVIAFRPELAVNLKYIRKQSAQLFSKMRYVSCQFLAYFENDLWSKNAEHANKMAKTLRDGISSIGDFEFTQPTDANIVLVKMPEQIIEQLLKNHFFYIWDEAGNEIRLATSWDTTGNDIDVFLNNLRTAYKK